MRFSFFVFGLCTSPRDRMWLVGFGCLKAELQSCACGCQAGRARSAARRGSRSRGRGPRGRARGIVEAAWNTSTSHSRLKPLSRVTRHQKKGPRTKRPWSRTHVFHDTRPDPPAPRAPGAPPSAIYKVVRIHTRRDRIFSFRFSARLRGDRAPRVTCEIRLQYSYRLVQARAGHGPRATCAAHLARMHTAL